MLNQPSNEIARNRFLYDFVFTPDSPEWQLGHLEYLPQMHDSAPGSCLFSAVLAVAFANFCTRYNAPKARELAVEKYAQAMKLLSVTVQDPVKAEQDETLLACNLLGMYEVRLGAFLQTHLFAMLTFQNVLDTDWMEKWVYFLGRTP